MEEFITVQKYAALHRLSIHNVVKKTMNGELKSIEKEENGKKTLYVRCVPLAPQPKIEAVASDADEIDYKKAYEDLNQEFLLLKTKYEKLLQTHPA
jgi:hypothetical protein